MIPFEGWSAAPTPRILRDSATAAPGAPLFATDVLLQESFGRMLVPTGSEDGGGQSANRDSWPQVERDAAAAGETVPATAGAGNLRSPLAGLSGLRQEYSGMFIR